MYRASVRRSFRQSILGKPLSPGDSNFRIFPSSFEKRHAVVFTRTEDEVGGVSLSADYSSWFFGDRPNLIPIYDAGNGLMRLNFSAPAGEAVECRAKTAEAAIGQCTFRPTDEVANSLNESDKAEYETMFTPVATSIGENMWSVKFELTEAATNALQETVNKAQTAVFAAIMDPAATTATVPAKPGFYYAFEYGSDLNLGANTADQLATGPSVVLDKPADTPPTRGFFRVKVSPSKIDSSPLNQSACAF